jgi:hypothetical protein
VGGKAEKNKSECEKFKPITHYEILLN